MKSTDHGVLLYSNMDHTSKPKNAREKRKTAKPSRTALAELPTWTPAREDARALWSEQTKMNSTQDTDGHSTPPQEQNFRLNTNETSVPPCHDNPHVQQQCSCCRLLTPTASDAIALHGVQTAMIYR